MPLTNYDLKKILEHWENESKKFQWYKTHQTVLEGDFHGDVKIKWFKEGQTNINGFIHSVLDKVGKEIRA